MYVYTYIYIYRERERKTERDQYHIRLHLVLQSANTTNSRFVCRRATRFDAMGWGIIISTM